jgi:hypothetical protein
VLAQPLRRAVWSYLLKVIWAISAMSEPTGPHGSLLVATAVSLGGERDGAATYHCAP